MTWGAALALVMALAGWPAGLAHAGEILDGVKLRGQLRCGVSNGLLGFSMPDGAGGWNGLEIDFCRAVAAAVLGDPQAIAFVPLESSTRFPALQAGMIDLLLRNTTWTLMREAYLQVRFPAVLLYDGQALMVPASAGVAKAIDLAGARICVEMGTHHAEKMRDWFAGHGLQVETLVLPTATGVADAFFAGKCAAWASDATQLAIARQRAPDGPASVVILPERLSKEPLAPVVPASDAQWTLLVRWVLFTLLLAEEYGFTRDNVAARFHESDIQSQRLQRLQAPDLVRALGVREDWIAQILSAVGNYSEMYERNLGSGSPLAIERGPNRLWSDGGLMYAPPLE